MISVFQKTERRPLKTASTKPVFAQTPIKQVVTLIAASPLLFFMASCLVLSPTSVAEAQTPPKFFGGFQMGPKADFYHITNGRKDLVNPSAVIGAQAGIIIGATFENKLLLETGLFNNQMHSSFLITSKSGELQSEVTFPSMRSLLIPIRLNLFYPLENNWNLYWGFGAYIMTREQIDRNPGIAAQIISQDNQSGTTDFLQYEISANYLTGSNIQVGMQAGAEKRLFENIYMSGEIFFRSAMSYINEYVLDYSSNNEPQRQLVISSRGSSPGVTIGLRYRPE